MGCIRSRGTGVLIQSRFYVFLKRANTFCPQLFTVCDSVLEDWGNVEGCKLSYFLNVESSQPCMQNRLHEDWEVLGRHHLYGRERCENLIGEGPSVSHHLFKEIGQFQVHGVNQASQSPCSFSVYQSPTFSFEFVPIPRPYPSAATYVHPCPPIA